MTGRFLPPRLVARCAAIATGVLLVSGSAAARHGIVDATGSAPAPVEAAAPAAETTTTTGAPPATSSTMAPEPTTTTTTAVPVTAPPPPPTTTTTDPPRPRSPIAVEASPFAVVAGMALVHPGGVVERVGFHESSHDGAQPLEVAPTAAAPMVLPSRARGTGAVTAADVVLDPDRAVVAPVTGTVKRAAAYVLYCRHRDEFAVIAPDDQPHLEVKLLHVRGLRVQPGDRVTAGETVVAAQPNPLPFESQVDGFTAKPSWPHVHVEVVDPAVKDRPSPGGGC